MKIKCIFILSVMMLFSPFFYAQATVFDKADIKIFDSNLNYVKQLEKFTDYKGEFYLSEIDLGNDGTSEFLVSQSRGGEPWLWILRADGSEINKFLTYDKNYRSGFSAVSCDLEGDSIPEIVTSAGIGGGPHIRIFDGYGNLKFNNGFFAFDKNLRGGASIACGDVNGDGKQEIITGSGIEQQSQVKIFDKSGNEIKFDYELPFFTQGQVNVASADLDHDSKAEIIVSGGKNNASKILILNYDNGDYTLFDAFGGNFIGGVNILADDYNQDSNVEILAGASYSGGPQIQVYNKDGRLLNQFFANDPQSRSGVTMAVGSISSSSSKQLLVLPQRTYYEGRTDHYKYVEIDISTQRLTQWENGNQLAEYVVSTGTYAMPTVLGEFKIMNKNPYAYSAAYDLYMPWWMEFYPSYGIHELPEWANGYKEGASHLGTRASHGCVRLGIGPAEKIYDWAQVGTFVWIHE